GRLTRHGPSNNFFNLLTERQLGTLLLLTDPLNLQRLLLADPLKMLKLLLLGLHLRLQLTNIGGGARSIIGASSGYWAVACNFVYGNTKQPTKPNVDSGTGDEKVPLDQSVEQSPTPNTAPSGRIYTPTSSSIIHHRRVLGLAIVFFDVVGDQKASIEELPKIAARGSKDQCMGELAEAKAEAAIRKLEYKTKPREEDTFNKLLIAWIFEEGRTTQGTHKKKEHEDCYLEPLIVINKLFEVA
ncbi:hypothetical protein PHJA_002845800, partial [Phtheirospermum japonicum]